MVTAMNVTGGPQEGGAAAKDGLSAQSAADQAGLTQLVHQLATACHHKILHTTPSDDDAKTGKAAPFVIPRRLFCNGTFDGWGCWTHTPAGTVATARCKDTIFFHAPEHALATKRCEQDGTWYISPLSNNTYSNYTACTQKDLEQNHVIPVYIFIAGFSLSIVMLVVSLVIFFAFRQLRCERITVHKNLFVSYILTGITWILYFVLVALNGDVLLANPMWCRLLHVLAQYLTTCNFAWMFCEGLYLHIIMAHAFRTGKTLIRVLLFVGWVDPLILTIIYAAVRGAQQSNTEACWLHADTLQWIIFGPVVFSVVVNILILINLVRLLVTKLRQVPDAPQSRKAVRATLILVPLFGLQYLIFPIRPDEGSPLYDFYHYFVALLISLQGALVSVMYCFCNGEVTSLLRRKWHQHRLMTGHVRKNTALTSSTYTEGYSVVNTSTRDLSGQRSKVAPDVHNKALQDVEMKALKEEKQDTVNHVQDT